MITFFSIPKMDKRKQNDLLVLPYFLGDEHPIPAHPDIKKESAHELPLYLGDFKAKEGEISLVYTRGKCENRIALFGLGKKDKISVEVLRRCFSDLCKFCQSKKFQTIAIVLPELSLPHLEQKAISRGISEGLSLANYAFESLKGDSFKDKKASFIKEVYLIGAEKESLAIAKKAEIICDSVRFARDLVNGNADDITPGRLSEIAKELARSHPAIKTTILDKAKIEKEKMGLLLAVSRGSSHDPSLIIVEYRAAPASQEHTILVGKGLTYDTGGLNLKPTGFMETMKSDMGGAATALATIRALASLELKVNVTAVIAAAENMIGADSFKPGDIYRSYSGKTVEIANTDAEGRLVLVDALCYAKAKLKPTKLIDFATLTGAVEIALGNEVAGMLSNDDPLAERLYQAGESTFERVWRLPLYEEYKQQLKSDFADLKNVGGKPAGCIVAAKFIHEFVGDDIPWAHFDIAGTAYLQEARRYHPKHGTGVGVRLMCEYFEQELHHSQSNKATKSQKK